MEEHQSLEERRAEEQRPLTEAGQGEAEGFEEAEKELIEHASHGDDTSDPSQHPGRPEERSQAEYGEADHEETSEEAQE